MKKVTSVVLLAILLTGICASVFAEDEIIGLDENLNELLMRNYFTQEELAEMEKEYMEYYSDLAINELIPDRQEMIKMQTGSVEEEYELIMEQAKVNFTGGLRVSNFLDYSYVDQYANVGCFEYLFNTKEYWLVPRKNTGNGNSRTSYKINGDKVEYEELNDYLGFYNSELYAQYKVLTLVEEKNIIKKLLNEKAETQVEKIKLCSIGSKTGLYIKCPEQEYFLKVYDYSWDISKKLDDEYYEFITAKELAKEYEQIWYSRNQSYVTPTKFTYDMEAEALQEDGLLLGTEKGLELLKPLTRAEAATILLRAMGESTEVKDVSLQTFSDVSPDYWGYGAVENSYKLGIMKGIGDNLFAPEDMVTVAQFSTMVLRASGTYDFDWETALNLLIEKGVISETDASTMDFFARCDMAKIIYEAKARNLF